MSQQAKRNPVLLGVEPEAIPAKVTEQHVSRPVFDEKTGKEIPGKRALKAESSWERFLRLNQHLCKEACTDQRATAIEAECALDRRDAGNAFVNAWNERQPGTRDCLDLSPRGGGTADGLTTAMIAAGKLLRSWQTHMGDASNDWMLIQRVCGEDHAVSTAVIEISPVYSRAAPARFREALTVLHRAQKQAERCHDCRAGRPHGSPKVFT